jgi:hypothetical protein
MAGNFDNIIREVLNSTATKPVDDQLMDYPSSRARVPPDTMMDSPQFITEAPTVAPNVRPTPRTTGAPQRELMRFRDKANAAIEGRDDPIVETIMDAIMRRSQLGRNE